MRWLQGDFSILAFADLLQQLVTNRNLGTLTVSQGADRKALHLSEEGLRLLSSTARRTNSLGEILLRTGKVSRERLELLLAEQKRSGVRLGELVRQREVVTQQDLMNALCEQAEEEIYEIFLWEAGAFEFIEGKPPEGSATAATAGAVITSNPTSIILEAARRADELHVIMKVVRDERLVPIRTGKPLHVKNLGMDVDTLRGVFAGIDGVRTVEDVIRVSLYPRFSALRAIYVLTKAGFVKLLDEKGMTAQIRQHTTRRFAKKPAAPAPALSGNKPTLVLLGDLVTYRSALANLLRSANYDVVEEAAAGSVQLISHERKIDGVILDIGIDNPSGYDFCTWLHENFKAPIVVLSADPTEDAVKTAVGAGAAAYVVKPFTRDAILKSIASAVAVGQKS